MYDVAAETLRALLSKDERVVFTGHSGGGAVAAYVYKELYREAVEARGSLSSFLSWFKLSAQVLTRQGTRFLQRAGRWTVSFSDARPHRTNK